MRFSDAGIASQTTAGWLGASRITHQQDPALLEAISHEFDRFVVQHGFELHRQVRDAHGCPNEREAACLWIVGERLFLRVIAHVQPKEIWARSRAWVRDKRSTRDLLVTEEAYDSIPLAEQLHQVGLEDHTDAMKQASCSMRADAELLADRAVTAVSGYQKLDTHCTRVPAGALADGGGDAIFILFEGHQFGPEAQISTELFGPRSQHRFQHILSNGTALRRAGISHEEVANIFQVTVELLAHQALHQQGLAAQGDRWLGLANGLLDPHTAEQLHCARSKADGARMNRGAGMAFDQQRVNAMP